MYFREYAVVAQSFFYRFFFSFWKNGIKLNDFIQIMKILTGAGKKERGVRGMRGVNTTIIIIYMNLVYSGSYAFDVFCAMKFLLNIE